MDEQLYQFVVKTVAQLRKEGLISADRLGQGTFRSVTSIPPSPYSLYRREVVASRRMVRSPSVIIGVGRADVGGTSATIIVIPRTVLGGVPRTVIGGSRAVIRGLPSAIVEEVQRADMRESRAVIRGLPSVVVEEVQRAVTEGTGAVIIVVPRKAGRFCVSMLGRLFGR